MSTMTNGRPAPLAASTSSTRAWTVHDASELYEVPRWGKGYFSVNAAGHLEVHPTKEPGARDRSEGTDRPPAAARHQPAGARSLHRHPQAPARRDPRRVSVGDLRSTSIRAATAASIRSRSTSSGRSSKRCSSSASPYKLRARGRLQAGAARRRRHGRQRHADHLQRLQGRRVHRDGDARPRRSAATSSRSSRNTPSSA